jgi:translation initiation factor 5B
MKDTRTEKKFQQAESCTAACGIKILAQDSEGIIAGSNIKTAASMEEAQKIVKEMEKEKCEVEVDTENDGLIIKSDTIGGLEAMKCLFKKYPIKEAKTGSIVKEDIVKSSANKDFVKVILSFNVEPSEEIIKFAKSVGVEIITSKIIYHLHENFEKYLSEYKENLKKAEVETVTRPGKLMILPGCVFRASNPAIVGCEVFGIVKPGYIVFCRDAKGEIKQIQSEGKNMKEASSGDKVAVSLSNFVVGRQIKENDILYNDISSSEYKTLKKHESLLSKDELNILEEIKEIKRKTEKLYGL